VKRKRRVKNQTPRTPVKKGFTQRIATKKKTPRTAARPLRSLREKKTLREKTKAA